MCCGAAAQIGRSSSVTVAGDFLVDENNTIVLQQMIDDCPTALNFFLERFAAKNLAQGIEGEKKFLDSFFFFLKLVQRPIEVDEYLKDIPHWYTSFDVDSMDPAISEGTGTPVPNGLNKEEALTCFGYFFAHEKTKSFEITEINPLLDKENAMAKFVHELLEGVLK